MQVKGDGLCLWRAIWANIGFPDNFETQEKTEKSKYASLYTPQKMKLQVLIRTIRDIRKVSYCNIIGLDLLVALAKLFSFFPGQGDAAFL